MRGKDPELMEKISRYIGEYYRKNHATPTTREIAAAMGICGASGYNYLVAMDKRGLITYENGEITGLPEIAKTEVRYFSAPLVGSIPCGDPEKESEEVEMYLSLPEAIFGKGDFYLLRAAGDSMTYVSIDPGDLVLIRKGSDCREGDVVVALDENNENTLKVYGGIDPETGKPFLKYANEEKYPGRVILVNELVVQGVAKHVIKALEPS
ncbi:MAG: repressor LexA [Lachnospiraceae bacterium]|nr:repressor LexA [Lachnospiraceae bacterium]